MSAVTIEAGCVRPLVLCVECGTFGPFVDREAGRAFKASHSLKHQRERDACAARARRAGGELYPPATVSRETTRRLEAPSSRYDFEELD